MIRTHVSDTGRIFVDDLTDEFARHEIDIQEVERLAAYVAAAIDMGRENVTVEFRNLVGDQLLFEADRRNAAHFVADLVEAGRRSLRARGIRLPRPANDRGHSPASKPLRQPSPPGRR